MRIESAGMAKYNKPPKWLLPKPGSRVRKLYNELFAHRGKVITLSNYKALASEITALKDYYGCDIRNFGRGRYSLVGEWVGKNYVDYVAESLEDES